jgi:hypothetical protein
MWLPDVTNVRDAFPNERRPPEDHLRDARALLNSYNPLDTYSDVIQGPGEAVDRRAGLDKLISLLVVARRFCIHSANASKRGK